MSEVTRIPGNEAVTVQDAAAREQEIFRPYHNRFALNWTRGMHSNGGTVPHFGAQLHAALSRSSPTWHAGLLYNRDARLATQFASTSASGPGLVIGDNEPYAVGDATASRSPCTVNNGDSYMSESSCGRIRCHRLSVKASGRNDGTRTRFNYRQWRFLVQIRLAMS